MFTGYELTKASRDKILKKFPPKYEKTICHHITEKFGVAKDAPAPKMPKSVSIVGYIDSGDGVEGLLVEIDGTSDRSSGSKYHITLSIDNDRKPVETNKYVNSAKIITPFEIKVIPKNFST